MEKNYTIKDIAKLCQVGKSTVSRVLNHDPKVSEETRKKVQAVIDSVGFKPNRSARAMRGAQNPVVGIIVSKFNSSGESQTLRAILTELYRQKITPIIVESQFDEKQVARHLNLFKQRQVDSVIVFGFSPLSEEILQQWQGNMVVIARYFKDISCVYYDDQGAINALMEKLYTQGYRHIGYLGIHNQDETTGRLRTQSYLNFCLQHHLVPNFALTELDIEAGYQHYAKLAQPLDAVLCATTSLAIGTVKHFQESQQMLPLAYIGQNSLLEHFVPNLISLDFGYEQTGNRAVALLLEQIHGNKTIQQQLVSFLLS
ncbi:trehalose operon repressor [Rodentibacter trehalosifermentans]|uniref:Trehalose operon repressor n=2 Tax=Rodentibacter trehalosifermentans TaxID=1908263 RepID=A0A1V3IXW0_9PAST|nr:LacI family DNA-binding transcriptional regulator [Rodentibacter trehalosifermentans]OOF47194.1 trehalose operon repressor [Rodentibacter trehalosifermentans]OOF49481.1 trehalose operon repressor [Rodentibacter trehalosifermentans]OOF52465.1 trehalose operon repressor [Rodentibacter trehalosifermentans]